MSQQQLRIVTYNIWFDRRSLVLRIRHIASVVLPQTSADVICLQEVTPVSFQILSQNPVLRDGYHFSPAPQGASYFTVVLARKALRPQFLTMRLPTEMGRKLLVAFLWPSAKSEVAPAPVSAEVANAEDTTPQPPSMPPHPEVVVATSHFESLSSRPLRKQQLQVAASLLKHHERWVLCGDFNFCSYRNYRGRQPHNLENTVLAEVLPPHQDAWLALHPRAYEDEAERGYTFDSCVNANIRQLEQMRYDRVLLSPTLRPVAMDLLGTEPLPPPSASLASRIRTNDVVNDVDVGSSEDDFDDDDDVVHLALPPQRPSKAERPDIGTQPDLNASPSAVAHGDVSPDGSAVPCGPYPSDSTGTSLVTPLRALPVVDASPMVGGSQVLQQQPLPPPVFQTPKRQVEIYPSDHFGLLCVVEF